MQTPVDSSLENLSDIYFDAADYEHLVHVERITIVNICLAIVSTAISLDTLIR